MIIDTQDIKGYYSLMSNALLIIDPQNDFSDPKGTLYVPGAKEDCGRIADFINKNASKINAIHITLDSHPTYHIAHPHFWVDENGNQPAPYTIITHQDFVKGLYRPSDSSLEKKAEEYILALENRGRYNLCIWPPHCLTATWGYCVEDQVWEAAHKWEIANKGTNIEYVKKALNPFTEHYSAIQAEVPDSNDPSTRTNFTFIDKLKEFEHIIIVGEALSHCVANTVRDLSVYIPPYRMIILTDCASNVAGFEQLGKDFINEYRAKGVQFVDSKTLILD